MQVYDTCISTHNNETTTANFKKMKRIIHCFRNHEAYNDIQRMFFLKRINYEISLGK